MQAKYVERLTYLLGTYSLLLYLLISAIYLTIASLIVRDIDYPKKHPTKFVMELIIMSILATFPYTYIHWLRNGGGYHKYVFSHSILVLKFAVFHLLLQFSGFYTALFKSI
jgi:uncharacterized membrane protein YvlD (DUF360 family)